MNRDEILRLFNSIDGWFYGDEGELLLSSAEQAMKQAPSKNVLEVGSYKGKSTVLLGWAAKNDGGKVYAVDPHQGIVTQPGGQTTKMEPTLDKFLSNMKLAGLLTTVQAVCKKSSEVEWSEPIGFLFIDGLHDYANVATDYAQFASWVPENGFIAFHDYNPMWPDVMRLVEERLTAGAIQKEKLVNSLLITRKRNGIGQM